VNSNITYIIEYKKCQGNNIESWNSDGRQADEGIQYDPKLLNFEVQVSRTCFLGGMVLRDLLWLGETESRLSEKYLDGRSLVLLIYL